MKIGDLVCWHNDNRYVGVVMRTYVHNRYGDPWADVRWITFPAEDHTPGFGGKNHPQNVIHLRTMTEKKK
jgi:hypothetical protein